MTKSIHILQAALFPSLLLLMPVTVTATGQELLECMQNRLAGADDTMTIGQLKQECTKELAQTATMAAEEPQAAGHGIERIKIDTSNILKPFTLMAHKPNYLLLGTYNSVGYNSENYQEQYQRDDIQAQKYEVQYQISIKFPVLIDIFDSSVDIYAAYTNRSFWQIWNDSGPFRESNHEPEIWLQHQPDFEIFGFRNIANAIGFNHQSNGQGGVLSRSWNRIFGWFAFENENMVISLKPWIRLKEQEENDDNPDITDYLGHFELSGAYKYGDHIFSIMSRNNLESGFSKGAFEFGWSFPLGDYPYFKGYIQYFTGYGESLIDYDQYVNRIGVGLLLTDWL